MKLDVWGTVEILTTFLADSCFPPSSQNELLRLALLSPQLFLSLFCKEQICCCILAVYLPMEVPPKVIVFLLNAWKIRITGIHISFSSSEWNICWTFPTNRWYKLHEDSVCLFVIPCPLNCFRLPCFRSIHSTWYVNLCMYGVTMMVCIYPGPLPDIYAETGTFRERIFKNFVCGNRLRGRKNGSISVSKFRKRRRHYFRQINNSWCVYSQSTSFEDCEQFWRIAAVWIVGHF